MPFMKTYFDGVAINCTISISHTRHFCKIKDSVKREFHSASCYCYWVLPARLSHGRENSCSFFTKLALKKMEAVKGGKESSYSLVLMQTRPLLKSSSPFDFKPTFIPIVAIPHWIKQINAILYPSKNILFLFLI